MWERERERGRGCHRLEKFKKLYFVICVVSDEVSRFSLLNMNETVITQIKLAVLHLQVIVVIIHHIVCSKE